MIRFLRLMLVALIAGAAVPALASDLVVIEAHGVGLTPGQVIDGNKILHLDVGQSVNLVLPSGDISTFDGPFDRAPAPEQGQLTLAESLKMLATQRSSDTSSLGAARHVDFKRVLPSATVIDIADSGDRCIIAGQPVVLWRPKNGGAGKLTLTPADRSWRAEEKSWPRGDDRLTVQSSFPVFDAAVYTATLDGVDATLVFHVIPASVAGKSAVLAAWMFDKHCDDQARALVHSLSP